MQDDKKVLCKINSMKKILGTLALTSVASLVATSFVFAQSDLNGLPPGQPGRPGEMRKEMMGEMRQEYKEGRKEIRGEYREDMKEARGEFREGMKERRMWNAQNASGTATGTKPTPWKEMREDMKDARKEFKGDMKDMRDDMKNKMNKGVGEFMRNNPVLNATQTAAIAAKLGITVDVLNAQLASGTKLKEIIKDKIKPEDMRNILPPRMATFTKELENKGFFGRLRGGLFGENKPVFEQKMNEFGEVTISTTTISVPATPFWKKMFGF
jgi:hypothetical protein